VADAAGPCARESAGNPALASLTLAHLDRVGDLLAGYGDDIDRDRIHGWWSYRCLTAVRWLIENGYGPHGDFPEVAMLLSVI
jgi:hypothetical protein